MTETVGFYNFTVTTDFLLLLLTKQFGIAG